MKSVYLYYLITSLIFNLYYSYAEVYRLCMNNKDIKSYSCHLLERLNSPVTCELVTDSVDCFLKIHKGEADFGVFTGEEALLASAFAKDDTQVIAQLRHRDRLNDSFAFQAVVLVKGEYNGPYDDLRGKNYCHPGFQSGQLWTDRILKEFEHRVVPSLYVDESKFPSAYKELLSLSKFFNFACRPGHWAMDDLLDNKLKQEFTSLCDLCDVPGRCAYDDEIHGSHKAAINCLTKNGGDIAYVALQYVNEYFGLSAGFKPQARADEYNFLCPLPGKREIFVQPLSQPCSWVKQPWPSVITSRSKSEMLRNIILQWLSRENRTRSHWQDIFSNIIEGTDYILFNKSRSMPLTDYIHEAGRYIPRIPEEKSKKVKLCSPSDEAFGKCSWLEQAVITHNIEPELSCVRSDNISQCFELIRTRKADIVNIDTDYGFIARNDYNLSAIMYEDGINRGGNYFIIAVLRKDIQNISSVANLKGKNACFPSYGGLAWISFIDTLKSHSLLPEVCPYAKGVSKFLSKACVPGLMLYKYQFQSDLINNLHSLCPNNTHSNNSFDDGVRNKYYSDFGAMRCLFETGADVAFVDYWNIFSDHSSYKLQNFTILCQNGTILRNVDILDEGCAFSVGTRAEIVGRKFRSKIETIDTTELLLKMDDWMGGNVFRYSNVINMYGPFNGKDGLIFKDTTVNMVPIHDHNYIYVESYVDLQRSSNEVCSFKGNHTSDAISNHLFTYKPLALIFSFIPASVMLFVYF